MSEQLPEGLERPTIDHFIRDGRILRWSALCPECREVAPTSFDRNAAPEQNFGQELLCTVCREYFTFDDDSCQFQDLTDYCRIPAEPVPPSPLEQAQATIARLTDFARGILGVDADLSQINETTGRQVADQWQVDWDRAGQLEADNASLTRERDEAITELGEVRAREHRITSENYEVAKRFRLRAEAAEAERDRLSAELDYWTEESARVASDAGRLGLEVDRLRQWQREAVPLLRYFIKHRDCGTDRPEFNGDNYDTVFGLCSEADCEYCTAERLKAEAEGKEG